VESGIEYDMISIYLFSNLTALRFELLTHVLTEPLVRRGVLITLLHLRLLQRQFLILLGSWELSLFLHV
jgi:hypothetical protein